MALTAYIDETGIHVPSYPEVLDDLKNEFRAIYGQDLYLEPDSQEGMLCDVFALRLYDCYTLAASVYNAYSPSTAQGVGLSSVVKTNGIRRRVASFSAVDLRIIGQAGTTIYRGIAADEAGRRWLLPEQFVIPLAGEITVTARAEEIGEIRAAPGEIKNIATPTRGWQAVINPLAATPGAPVETDAGLRTRQRISTALPSRSIFDGTDGAVASLPGVSRSRGYENDTDEYDANDIPPHSISFVVEGGDTQAIGETIAVKKGPGCGTYGTTLVNTLDKWGTPADIRFFRPEIVELAVTVQINPLAGYWPDTGRTCLYIRMCGRSGARMSRLSTSLPAASPVRTCPARAAGPASPQQRDRDYGMSMRGLSARSGRVGRSSKTSRACSPAAWKSSCRSFPPSGTMRNGSVCRQPPLERLTCVRGFSLLPTPTVAGLTQNVGYLLRSKETWEKSSNLGAYLSGLEYGLSGRQERPPGRHTVDLSFVEWMMGVPQGWTNPEGPSLAG